MVELAITTFAPYILWRKSAIFAIRSLVSPTDTFEVTGYGTGATTDFLYSSLFLSPPLSTIASCDFLDSSSHKSLVAKYALSESQKAYYSTRDLWDEAKALSIAAQQTAGGDHGNQYTGGKAAVVSPLPEAEKSKISV